MDCGKRILHVSKWCRSSSDPGKSCTNSVLATDCNRPHLPCGQRRGPGSHSSARLSVWKEGLRPANSSAARILGAYHRASPSRCLLRKYRLEKAVLAPLQPLYLMYGGLFNSFSSLFCLVLNLYYCWFVRLGVRSLV